MECFFAKSLPRVVISRVVSCRNVGMVSLPFWVLAVVSLSRYHSIKLRRGAKLKKILTLLVILFLFVLTQWSSSVYLPIAPKVAALFSSHKQLIISSLSLFFLGYAFGQLFWGILSDYIGRYFTLLIALIIYFIFELSMISIHNAIGFVILLAITGFTVSANTSVGNALIKEKYGKKAKAIIGYVGIAMACAPVIAPIIGSHLYVFSGWKSIFIFLSIVAILILIPFSILFKPTNKNTIIESEESNTVIKKNKPRMFVMLKETLVDKKFVNYSITLAITFGVFFSLLLLAPFLLADRAHFSVNMIGYLMFAITLTYIIGAVLNVLLAKKKNSKFIVNLGLLFMSFGALLFLFNSFLFAQLISIINLFAAAICMFGIGIVLPASKAGAMMTRENHIGTAASVMKFTQTVGCVILTKIASYCINHDDIEAFLIALVAIILFLSLFSMGITSVLKIGTRRDKAELR